MRDEGFLTPPSLRRYSDSGHRTIIRCTLPSYHSNKKGMGLDDDETVDGFDHVALLRRLCQPEFDPGEWVDACSTCCQDPAYAALGFDRVRQDMGSQNSLPKRYRQGRRNGFLHLLWHLRNLRRECLVRGGSRHLAGARVKYRKHHYRQVNRDSPRRGGHCMSQPR